MVFPLEGNCLHRVIGDQQAACLGNLLQKNQIKCTYGTGCFLMLNTGSELILSKSGLLSTVCFKIKGEPINYALEGSVEMGGAAINWAQNNLNLYKNIEEFHSLLISVSNSGGVYFVPAFSGLFAPYWDSTAKGLFIGLSQNTTKAHIVRSMVDGICLRVNDVIKSMSNDIGCHIDSMKVDGGLTVNDVIMGLQADYSNIKINRKEITELTALGSVIAAGIGCGVWDKLSDIEGMICEKPTLIPKKIDMSQIDMQWEKAKSRSMGWTKEN